MPWEAGTAELGAEDRDHLRAPANRTAAGVQAGQGRAGRGEGGGCWRCSHHEGNFGHGQGGQVGLQGRHRLGIRCLSGQLRADG